MAAADTTHHAPFLRLRLQSPPPQRTTTPAAAAVSMLSLQRSSTAQPAASGFSSLMYFLRHGRLQPTHHSFSTSKTANATKETHHPPLL